jgi:hypothetical protein
LLFIYCFHYIRKGISDPACVKYGRSIKQSGL